MACNAKPGLQPLEGPDLPGGGRHPSDGTKTPLSEQVLLPLWQPKDLLPDSARQLEQVQELRHPGPRYTLCRR